MVRRLVAGGHEVQVAGRSDSVLAGLLADGATPVASVKAVAAGADAVMVCVFSDEQVWEVARGEGLLEAMEPGSVLVLHTTGSPSTARKLAELAAPRRVAVVDATVSGGPDEIAAGEITVFVGGDQAAVDRVRHILGCYAEPLLHVGGTGSGQVVKLLNNALFAANVALVGETARVAVDLGIAEQDLLKSLRHGSSDSRALGMIERIGSSEIFANTVGEFLGKDVAAVRRVASDLGADLGVLRDVLDSPAGISVLGAALIASPVHQN